MEFVAKWFDELSLNELYEILKVRSQVFIVELGMRCQDADGVDQTARHCFLRENGKIVAYLRAFYTDADKRTVRVGRVLSVAHGRGWGAEVMCRAMEDLRTQLPCEEVCLDSQTHAAGFYEKLGFRTVSEEFIEAGVPHVKMRYVG